MCKNQQLSGVVSFGIGCATAETYGIYTSLPSQWFENFLENFKP